MNAGWQIWWGERSPRERMLLAVMAVLVLAVIGWLAVMRPLDAWVQDGRETYRQALVERAEGGRQIAEIEAIKAQPVARLPKPLDQALLAVAAQGGFSDVRTEPGSNGGVRLAIAAVRTGAFFPWLRETSRRHGLIVESLNVTPNSDRTLSVAVTFRERAS